MVVLLVLHAKHDIYFKANRLDLVRPSFPAGNKKILLNIRAFFPTELHETSKTIKI
jgi:hypothetical protein